MTDEPRPNRLTVFRRADGKYDWKAFAANGNELFGSLQGYERHSAAVAAAKRDHPGIDVDDEEVTP